MTISFIKTKVLWFLFVVVHTAVTMMSHICLFAVHTGI